MICHNFSCKGNHVTERMVRSGQRFIKCPECGRRAEKVWLTRLQLNAARFRPVVYLENAAGEKIIPPADDKEIAAMMPDYVQKEARTLAEVRELTKHLDRQSQEKFLQYHGKRIENKRRNTEANLEFALRAREKMSDPLAQKMTDYAISRMQDQRREIVPEFRPSGHFEAFE